MINVEKANESIQELEENVIKIKEFGGVVTKVGNISKQMNTTIKVNKEIVEKYELFEKKIIENYEKYEMKLENMSSDIKEQESLFVNQIHDMRSENKKIIMEVEDTIEKKIQRLKTDIELENRAIIKETEEQIKKESKRIIEDTHTLKEELLNEISDSINQNTKKLRMTLFISTISLACTIGVGILIIIA